MAPETGPHRKCINTRLMFGTWGHNVTLLTRAIQNVCCGVRAWWHRLPRAIILAWVFKTKHVSVLVAQTISHSDNNFLSRCFMRFSTRTKADSVCLQVRKLYFALIRPCAANLASVWWKISLKFSGRSSGRSTIVVTVISPRLPWLTARH